MTFYVDVRLQKKGQDHRLIVHLDSPVLQQLYRHVPYKHIHLFGPGHPFTPSLIVSHMDTKIPSLAVLSQYICAGSLKVQHAPVESAVVWVSEGDARGRTRDAVRAAETRHHSGHLVCVTGERRAAFCVAVHLSKHTTTAGAFVHFPALLPLVLHTLEHTRPPRIWTFMTALSRNLDWFLTTGAND